MKNVFPAHSLPALANPQEMTWVRLGYDEAYDVTVNFRKCTITALWCDPDADPDEEATEIPLADLEAQLPSDWRFVHPMGSTFSLEELRQKGFTFRMTM